jgi:CheY-like chemotaxis protein
MNRKSVLIVDDTLMNRQLLISVISDFGEMYDKDDVDVDTAVNGQEAVDMCKNKRYDLVLMDIMMPVLDGIEATRQICLHDDAVTVLAVSGSGSDDHQQQILDVGAVDYIPKPIDVLGLYEKMNALLHGEGNG